MSHHQFCDFYVNTCQTLYNSFVLVKPCKCYTLLSKYILLLFIILILCIFDIYQNAYLSSYSIVYKVFAYVSLT